MEEVVAYDEAHLVERLDTLAPHFRVAFAAACAERQFLGYLAFHDQTGRGDPGVMRSILDLIWSDLTGQRRQMADIEADLERCMGLIPEEDEGPWCDAQAYAEDAAASLAYALRSHVTGSSQEAAWAARRAYEALDHYVTNHVNQRWNEPGVEQTILADPLIQAEIRRQLKDLADLAEAQATNGFPEVFASLRLKSERDARSFLGPTRT